MFNFTPAGQGLVLVEVNVTAQNHSATDLGGVLVVPATVGPSRFYIGVVGNITLTVPPGILAGDAPVQWGEHHGHYYIAEANTGPARIRIDPVAEETQAAFLISLKTGAGTGQLMRLAIAPSDERVMYMSTRGAGVFRSADAGRSWERTTASNPDVAEIVVSPTAPRTALVVVVRPGLTTPRISMQKCRA